MKFNPEINLGTVIEVLVFALAVVGGIMKFSALETKLNIMFDWFQRSVIGVPPQGDEAEKDIRRFHGGKS